MRGLRGGSQKSEKGKHPPDGQKEINENPKQKRMIICPF